MAEQGIFGMYAEKYANHKEVDMSLEDYLRGCSRTPAYYAGPAERLLKAIGEPLVVDMSKAEPRLARIFMNRTMKVYPAFEDFYGMEETIERIVSFFRHAAQGLEERKQVLYLLGPVGGGKSSIAERLKLLMEKEPIYVLAAPDKSGKLVPSPIFESPLGLFEAKTPLADTLEKEYGIPERRLTGVISPWAVKRLDELGGDITKFRVMRMVPSRLKLYPVGITKATILPGTPSFSISSMAFGSAASELVVAKASDTGSASACMNLRSGTFTSRATGNRTPNRKTASAA